MRKIKTYNQFFSVNENEMSEGEKLSFQLTEFKTKKDNLKRLILTNIDTDKDIEQNLEDIIGENTFLQLMSRLYKIEAGILKKENRIKDNEEKVKTINTDLNLVNKLSDDVDKQNKQTELKEKIKDIEDSSKQDSEDIKDMQNQHKELEKEIQNTINQKTEELRSIQNNSFEG